MLTIENNELLTRTDIGTPMGRFMRRHWMPVARSIDVVQNDRPLRIRLLGEDLVMFRDGSGRVGVVNEYCAHRRASLAFGRSDAAGVRCIYHGWQYDITGQCIDMPNEPLDSDFKEKVRQPAYPVRERNGVLWVFLDHEVEPPDLPDLEFNLVPEENVYISLRVQECNWLQALEGSLDSSHAPFLHGRIDQHEYRGHFQLDKRPRFEVLDTDYGVMVGARRQGPNEESYHWRINQFLMPFYTLVPPGEADPAVSGQAWIPIDDHTTLVFMFSYHPTEALPESLVAMYRDGRRDGTESGYMSVQGCLPHQNGKPYPDFWPAYNAGNDYAFDMERQRTRYFSGIPGIWPQDAACQEGMGPIASRQFEHLGSTDAGILRSRRRLIAAVRAHEKEGTRVPTMDGGAVYRVRPVGLVASVSAPSMVEATGDFARKFGEGFGYDPY